MTKKGKKMNKEINPGKLAIFMEVLSIVGLAIGFFREAFLYGAIIFMVCGLLGLVSIFRNKEKTFNFIYCLLLVPILIILVYGGIRMAISWS